MMSWVKERCEQLKIISLFLMESTVTLDDPLALRNKTRGEVLWRSLRYGVTGVCSNSAQRATQNIRQVAYCRCWVSNVLTLSGIQSHFVWLSDNLFVSALRDQGPSQSLWALFFCLKTRQSTSFAFLLESQIQDVYFYNKAPSLNMAVKNQP